MKTGKHWTKAEDQIIRDNYGICTIAKICNLLPQRGKDAIFQRAYKLGITTKSSRS